MKLNLYFNFGNREFLQFFSFFSCLDASLAMKPVLGRYYCVVITSGKVIIYYLIFKNGKFKELYHR